MESFARALWRCRLPLSVLCALGFYVLVLPFALMCATSAHYRASAATVPPAGVGVVFGAGAPGGEPTPMLVGRLQVALDLYRRGRIQVLLLTGDNSRTHYNEPRVMNDYLVRQGVPSSRIVLDYAGFDTWDSCVRAKKIFGVDRAILITQRFHLPRALTLCRAVGIDAHGVGDDSMTYAPDATINSYAREVLAALKATYSLVMRPDPRFLGPREPGVRQALQTAR